MEFTHERSNNKSFAEDEDELEEDERDELRSPTGPDASKLHPFLPLSPSSSSPISPSQPSASSAPVQKEHMFEKIVTPSDVGKLNRLVIPKQHAEKYFPLDASTHDRGLLLNFEDRNGKPWRFRYSYWNSSQSYVMTKGWSRFVKEKRLDAGDTVFFGRGTGDTASHRLFIDWKRRPDPHINPPALRLPRFPYQPSNSNASSTSSAHPHPYLSFARSTSAPWAAGRLFVPHAAPPASSNYFYFRPKPNPTALDPPVPAVLDSIPVTVGKEAAEPKRLRLFGVNIEQTYDNSGETSSLHRLQLNSPFSSRELRHGGNDSSSAASSSSSAKDSRHSPPLDMDM